ncbi:hypothetical protein UT300003_33010 [Clostridium sardiniense]
MKAEQKYSVNAIFLLSLTAHESYWGKSERAVKQNNLTGYNVTSDEAEGKNFNSKEHSIMATAELLGKEYLTPKGLFYTGGYDIYRVNAIYCPVGGNTWSDDIVSIAEESLNKINKQH